MHRNWCKVFPTRPNLNTSRLEVEARFRDSSGRIQPAGLVNDL